MIAAWMAYALMVAAFSAAAAWALENLLRSHRRPVRWVWFTAIAFSLLWPTWMALRPENVEPLTGPPPVVPQLVMEPLTLEVGSYSIWHSLEGPLVAFWVIASAMLLALAVLLFFRTRRLRKRWTREELGGRAIFISEEWGPAVVGFLDPQIVLPGWCQAIAEGELRLILDHEAEHQKAGDLRLLIVAGIAPVFLPWSLPLWWMWRRLRLATEGDCDLRVLRKNPRATREYLELLLEVGRRSPGRQVAAAMLSEPEKTLERRIRIMTMPFPKKPWLRGITLAGIGLFLVAVACEVPLPYESDREAAVESVEVGEDQTGTGIPTIEGVEPVFTPFTVRPDITNREEISLLMEAEYPPLLRDAGIGGTTQVWLFIDAEGIVRDVRVRESSDHPALAEAALRVASRIRFTPALNGDEPVAVWIALPITFSVSNDESPRSAPPPPSETEQVRIPPTPDEIQEAEEGGDELEPPPEASPQDGPVFTPFTVRPDISNRREISRAMEEEYPPLLRDAGIGGTAQVWFYIDEEGVVQRVLINESSGHQALDEAVLRVARVIEFTPALNRDKRVPVWISLPITFTTR